MSAALQALARDIAGEEELEWKLWLENREAGRAGGVYRFHSVEAAHRYRAKHEARLAAQGIGDMQCRSFDANEPLSALAHAVAG